MRPKTPQNPAPESNKKPRRVFSLKDKRIHELDKEFEKHNKVLDKLIKKMKKGSDKE